MNIFAKIKNYLKKENQEVGILYQSVNLRSSNSSWTMKQFFNAYEQSIYFAKAIDKRAEKVGEVEFVLKKGEEGEVVNKHEFLDLLNNPNPLYSSSSEYWKMWQKYYDLAGVNYIHIDTEIDYLSELNKPTYNYKKTKLWLLEPHRVTELKSKETGLIIKYKYKDEDGNERVYDASQVIRTYNHNLKDQLKFQSPVMAGSKTIDIDNQLSQYQANVLDNGGSIDGIMSFKGNLKKDQLDRLKEGYEKEYGDAKKAKRPLFLGGEADYKRMSFTPEELSFNDSKKMTLNDIVILTGVPKVLLGAVDDIKYSNASESIKVFLSETVRPLLNNLIEALGSKEGFVPKGFILDYENIIKEDEEFTLKRIENGTNNHYMTINERRELAGLETLPDGDKILIPFSLVNMENVDKVVEDVDKEKTIIKSENIEHPLKNAKYRKIYGQFKVAKEEKNEKIFERVIKDYFKGQEERLLSDIKSIHKNSKRYKNIIDETFNQSIEVKLAYQAALPLLTEFLLEAGVDTAEMMGYGYNFVLSSEISSWLDNKTNVFARQINDTTFNKLKEQFAESLANEETRDQLVRRIEETYGNITKARAKMIARTEVGGVMSKGTFESYKQMNIPIKIWVAVNDANTRHSHSIVDGEEKPLDIPFSNGLQYPREAGAPAGEVINCRCQI